jgi:bifunctional polynucleotide phosphatase/kinase
VAAFDMDGVSVGCSIKRPVDCAGTIITTKSGRTFAKDENDWQYLYAQVPQKLNDAHDKHNMKIVFFTNQKGISIGKQPLQPFKNKVEDICRKIRAPIQVRSCFFTGFN